jgi:hypothetical protein
LQREQRVSISSGIEMKDAFALQDSDTLQAKLNNIAIMTSLQIPPDTWKIRNLLFEMPVPFSMRADVFEKFWPLVDNIWSRYDEMNLIGRGVDCTSTSSLKHIQS